MDLTNKINPQFSVLITFGERLKALRGYTGLSRKEFSKRCAISEASWKSWENNTGKLIRESSMIRIIDALQKLGVPCTKDWLSLGSGISPFDAATATYSSNRSSHIFHTLCAAPMHHIVQDNNFEAKFPEGTYLGCIPVVSHEWEEKLGELLLFKIAPEERMFLGYLVNGTTPDTFSIICHEKLNARDSLMIDAPITMICKISLALQLFDFS